MTTTASPRSRPTFASAIGVLAGAAVSIVVLAFLWPAATAEPRDLPVGVVGGQLPEALTSTIDATIYETRDEAVRAVREREVYGTLVLDRATTEVIVAGAGNAAVRPLLEGIGAQLAGAQGTTLSTTDVVPLSEDDPSGSGINAMSFPLVLGGIVGGVLVSLLLAGVARRMLALALYAAIGGTLTAVVTGPLLGIAAGDFWTDVLVLAVGMLGTASTVVGLNALIGPAGIGVGAVITMLIANPISGANLPYQFISGPWGEIGQYFVPGAATSLFREANYFPAASSLHEWVVLAAWIVAGVALSMTGRFRSATPIHLPESELEDDMSAGSAG